MAKTVDSKKTLAHAVAFIFPTAGSVEFKMGNKYYQHVQTVYDRRYDNGGCNTLEVAYDYKAQKYVVFYVDDPKVGQKEISIV